MNRFISIAVALAFFSLPAAAEEVVAPFGGLTFGVGVIDAFGNQPICLSHKPAGRCMRFATRNVATDAAGIVATASGLNAAVSTTQSVSGTSGPMVLNPLNITSDQANLGVNFLDGWIFLHNFGGGAASGGRETVKMLFNQYAQANKSSLNRNYVPLVTLVQSATGDGGSNTGSGALGAYFAMNANALLTCPTPGVTCASNVLEITGTETNVAVQKGASVKLKYGMSIVGRGDDAVHGTAEDDMLALSRQGGAGCTPIGTACAQTWYNGIKFTNANGQFPIDATGTLIGSTAATVTNGIDLSSLTIKGYLIKGAGAIGIDGAGAIHLPVYTVATLPTCSAGEANAMAAVSDASAPIYNGALKGGGAVHIPVFCNASTWTAH